MMLCVPSLHTGTRRIGQKESTRTEMPPITTGRRRSQLEVIAWEVLSSFLRCGQDGGDPSASTFASGQAQKKYRSRQECGKPDRINAGPHYSRASASAMLKKY